MKSFHEDPLDFKNEEQSGDFCWDMQLFSSSSNNEHFLDLKVLDNDNDLSVLIMGDSSRSLDDQGFHSFSTETIP